MMGASADALASTPKYVRDFKEKLTTLRNYMPRAQVGSRCIGEV